MTTFIAAAIGTLAGGIVMFGLSFWVGRFL
jgi:hypothetical protein